MLPGLFAVSTVARQRLAAEGMLEVHRQRQPPCALSILIPLVEPSQSQEGFGQGG